MGRRANIKKTDEEIVEEFSETPKELKAPKRHEINNYISESIENIRIDRAFASLLLKDLFALVKKSEDKFNSHKELGTAATKYLETMQRSNEQLVKLTSILQKRQEKSGDLSSKDKEEIFKMLHGDDDEEEN